MSGSESMVHVGLGREAKRGGVGQCNYDILVASLYLTLAREFVDHSDTHHHLPFIHVQYQRRVGVGGLALRGS